MNKNFLKINHFPVLLNETIKLLKIKKNGIYIDGTFGCGGHSSLILKNLGEDGKLYAIDRDSETKIYAKKIKDKRFQITHCRFSKMLKISKKNNIIKKVNGIILDLGVSTLQLKTPNRGFSFMLDGPLDMRMDQKKGIPVSQWLLKSKKKEIEKILLAFGEEKFSKKIASAIKKQNLKNPISTTKQLSNIISKVIPNNFKRKKNPCTKSFQALRILINQELDELKKVLKDSLRILAPGGRIAIISFHSLEDRIVKQFFKKYSSHSSVPIRIPITERQIQKINPIRIKNLLKKRPSSQEVLCNPRSRSAILRIAELI